MSKASRLEKKVKKYNKSKNDAFSNSQIILDPNNDEDRKIAFSFMDLHKDYGFANDSCSHQFHLDLLSKLLTASCKTWSDMLATGKKSGFETITISDKMRKIMPASVLQRDINKFYVMRCNGQSARLIGYRIGQIFYIVFIDTKFELYEH